MHAIFARHIALTSLTFCLLLSVRLPLCSVHAGTETAPFAAGGEEDGVQIFLVVSPAFGMPYAQTTAGVPSATHKASYTYGVGMASHELEIMPAARAVPWAVAVGTDSSPQTPLDPSVVSTTPATLSALEDSTSGEGIGECTSPPLHQGSRLLAWLVPCMRWQP